MPQRRSRDRLERLTNLVLALLNTPRPMSLREIGDSVAGYPSEPAALRQAFERDKRLLRDSGIPIELERLPGGPDQAGYRILPEHYYLPDLELTAEEQLALGFAMAAVRLEGLGGRDALGKLGSPEVPDLPPVAVLPATPALGPLQEAVRRRAVVSFHYGGKARRVEPYGLCFRNGAWYLVANDLGAADGGALRTFRADRLEGGEPKLGPDDAFCPPADLDLAEYVRYVPWQRHGGESVEVIVEVDPYEARSVIDLVGPKAVEDKRADGTVRLRFRVADEEGFAAWLVGLGDAAVVLSPPRCRQKVIDRLQAIVAGGGA